jgi:hypothetical protein
VLVAMWKWESDDTLVIRESYRRGRLPVLGP